MVLFPSLFLQLNVEISTAEFFNMMNNHLASIVSNKKEYEVTRYVMRMSG